MQKVKELEGNIANLIINIESLNKVIVEKGEECELYKRRYGEL